jgi:GNAT superfamily N-acetyltransferase
MSFWSQSPGPFWSHWFTSLFCREQETGVLDMFVHKKPRVLFPPSGTHIVEFNDSHAKDIQILLSEHYQTFPRSRIFLTASRIQEGFLYDNWIGVGVYNGTKLIGCVISRDIGTISMEGNETPNVGYIDFFCVAAAWRKKGIASLLLQEIVIACGKQNRLVQVFQKEGLPLSPLPPLWQSRYIWRKKGIPGESSDYLGKEGIATRSHVSIFNYTSYVPFGGTLSSKPSQLTGDSEIYSFNYRGYIMSLCITDTFHRSVPEGWKIGEILWILPKDDVPLNIQKLAVETLVDSCKYDMVLMDKTIPHQKDGWESDSPYGLYAFNYNTAHFFSLKPYLVF